jgi:hypothetical protein
MTHFLKSEEKPDGHRLEDILTMVRADIILRASKLLEDERPEAKRVLENDIKILGWLSDSVRAAEDSTQLLTKSFGKSTPGKPRVGST